MVDITQVMMENIDGYLENGMMEGTKEKLDATFMTTLANTGKYNLSK